MLIRQDLTIEDELDTLVPPVLRGAKSGAPVTADAFTAKDAARFWSKVARGEPGECWRWLATAYRPTGAGGRACYGMFTLGGKMLKAHRVAFALSVRPLAAGELVMHRCDNPKCCNPAHLEAGTPSQNMHDMMAKGRHPRPKGEAHHNARLDDVAVVSIRAASKAGASFLALARRYGVSKTLIANIIHRKAWRHV